MSCTPVSGLPSLNDSGVSFLPPLTLLITEGLTRTPGLRRTPTLSRHRFLVIGTSFHREKPGPEWSSVTRDTKGSFDKPHVRQTPPGCRFVSVSVLAHTRKCVCVLVRVRVGRGTCVCMCVKLVFLKRKERRHSLKLLTSVILTKKFFRHRCLLTRGNPQSSVTLRYSPVNVEILTTPVLHRSAQVYGVCIECGRYDVYGVCVCV